jgi:hypothetical protein
MYFKIVDTSPRLVCVECHDTTENGRYYSSSYKPEIERMWVPRELADIMIGWGEKEPIV